MLGLVNSPNDLSLSIANQSQAKFKSAVGGNLLQSWVNLTIVKVFYLCKWIIVWMLRERICNKSLNVCLRTVTLVMFTSNYRYFFYAVNENNNFN